VECQATQLFRLSKGLRLTGRRPALTGAVKPNIQYGHSSLHSWTSVPG